MAILTDLPFEMLSIPAADSVLTNRDRKQARLACSQLAAVMTPVIFRRAYISRIKADRDAFLNLAATPHLAAHVEEIIWFDLEIDWRPFEQRNGLDVELSDGRNVNLFLAARDIFWLPVEARLQRNGYNKFLHRSPPECSRKFLVQFKAAVACMPKLHTFTSEQMAPHRIVSLADGFPFEVGQLMTNYKYDSTEACSDFLHIFLETIAEEKGRINKLHCGNELSASLARIDPRHHAAMQYLTSLELSISDFCTTAGYDEPQEALRNAMYKSTELRELSVSVDCNSELVRDVKPVHCFYGLIVQHRPLFPKGALPKWEVPRWEHLRSLKLGSINLNVVKLLPLIKAHVTTLRHLHLDQCRPAPSFARQLSQLDGLQLDSITISDSEIPKSGLVSEEELLRYIRGEDVGNKRLATKIGRGKFVTHNRRADNIDDEAFEDPETDSNNQSDHSSEWWSDTDSESEPDTVSASSAWTEGPGKSLSISSLEICSTRLRNRHRWQTM